jgi:hypothetical protein
MLLLLACGGPEPAPAEMNALTRYLWEQWDDQAAMDDAVDQLLAQASEVDLAADKDDRSYIVLGLDSEAVGDKVEHSYDPADVVGAGLLHESQYPIEDHFNYMWLEDQVPLEPTSKEFYRRTFIEGDEDCITGQTCDYVLLLNEVQRDTALYTLNYDIHKQFRWAESDNGPALMGRSWNLDEADGGAIQLLQAYSLDIYAPQADGTTLRYHLSWQESEPLDDADITGALVNGIDDLLSHHDSWLEENL